MRGLSLFLMAFVLAVGGGPARAVPLQSLFDGGVLAVDDKIFFDWTLINVVSTDPASDPDFAQIDVVPLGGQPLNPGIRFNASGQFSVVDDNFLDVEFGFSVAVTGPQKLRIHDNSLELVDFDFGGPGGAITIIETVFGPGGDVLAEKFVEADNLFNSFDLVDEAVFRPQKRIDVEKNILLAGDFLGDSVSLNVFEQRFSQVVAEPPTLLLLAGGLAALGVAVRRRRKTAGA